jgi:hypothetical protein
VESNQEIAKATKSTGKLAKCDFKLVDEFLTKVKIFLSQTNEKSFKGLIQDEVQKACKATKSVANFVYTKLEEGFLEWWENDGKVLWLNEKPKLWEDIEYDMITEIDEISDPEIKAIKKCDTCVEQQNVQELVHYIRKYTVIHIVTNSKSHILQKKETYEALKELGHTHPLFYVMKAEFLSLNKLKHLWPCQWSKVLVVDCDSADNAQTVLERLQQPADCSKESGVSYDSKAKSLLDVLKNEHKLILISPQIEDLVFQEKLVPGYKKICR